MKLSTEKRNQFIFVSIGVVMALVIIWFLLINPLHGALQKAKKDAVDKRQHLVDMDNIIKRADSATNELRAATSALSSAEADMASGDPNAWAYDLIRHFKENYKVDISINGQASIDNVDLIPDFPYQQLKVSVNGTAFYHDLGNFIANFENTFPHIRITNLEIDTLGGNGDSAEKLSFHMEIIALIKSK
jgi:hypothetical protein